MTYFLFYLLLLFLPTQLGRHFFFDFAQIYGIHSDYLTPTIYLTDLISIILVISVFINQFQSPQKILKLIQDDIKSKALLLIISYLLFNIIFIAVNKWAALYEFIKFMEFLLLGIAVFHLKPKLLTFTLIASIGVFYSSIIAIWQFVIQKSIGGIFWWLGERTFYADTPGIAALSFKGNLLLRPYATFPHPNVLGGFLAVILTLIFFYLTAYWKPTRKLLRIWFIVILMLGLSTLILTFSRAAWCVAFFGFAGVLVEKKFHLLQKLQTKKGRVLLTFYLLIILSITVPLLSPKSLFANLQYWQERTDLIKSTVSMVSSNTLFGVGLNNSITQMRDFAPIFSGNYIFQPVHNVYLLIFAETGIIGLFILMFSIVMIVSHGLKSKTVFFYSITQLFILGLFDHYLVTLQQSQLLLVVFTALYFMKKVAY